MSFMNEINSLRKNCNFTTGPRRILYSLSFTKTTAIFKNLPPLKKICYYTSNLLFE